jgi:subtilase family serine protease
MDASSRVCAFLGAGLVAGLMALVSFGGQALGQASAEASGAKLVPLVGQVHRLAQARFDAGEAPATLRLSSLNLVLAKTADQQRALNQLLADQQNPKSPSYHQWLTPSEYGTRFGASDVTIAALSQWLKTNGFVVGPVPAGRGHLPFSGTKTQVEQAFHTSIHLFNVNGEQHYSNLSDPMLPASLMPYVVAIRGLNDFHPKPGVKPSKGASRVPLPMVGHRANAGSPSPDTYYGGGNQYPGYVGPSDFATMYNLTPLYQTNITGAGVTVVIVGQSNISANVLKNFWTAFGVYAGVSGSQFASLPAQSFSSVPGSSGAPGETGDGNEDEAYLDTEIVGALAPGAKLILVRDQSAQSAAQYAIDQNLGAVLNISFGDCESDEAGSNSMVSSMFSQAASQGMTVIVSSADAGVAACTAASDLGASGDVNSPGFGVNGLASTPYNLAVGGTDFNPNTETTYWGTSNTTTGTLESALSHIPEMVWNDSCADPVLAQYYTSNPNEDPIVFCNTAQLGPGTSDPNQLIEISGAGGGLSGCTTTDNQGNCNGGYAQPSWQANVAGIANFGTRAIPDVSLIATRWLICSYNTSPCDPTQAPTFTSSSTIEVLEGTSAAAPAMAAIVAMLDQSEITSASADGRQGLINPMLYKLAAAEYASATTLAACNANQGAITSALCVFNDITSGSNAQPCSVAHYAAASAGSLPASTCGSESGDTVGIMETTGGVQSYAAGSGFDIATGLGSINAANLVAALKPAAAPTNLKVTASGTTATLTWTADSDATQGYNIYAGTSSGQETLLSNTNVSKSATTYSVAGLSSGHTYYFEISAVTDIRESARSNEVTVTLAPAAVTDVSVTASAAGSLAVSWTAAAGATSYQILQSASAGAEGTTPVKSGITATSYTATGLTAGQQYFFEVVAVNAGGSSPTSTEASGTVLPATPTGLAATAGNATASLTWTAATGAATYNIYEGTAAGAEGTTAIQTGITGTSASVTGLTNGKAYYFTIAAVDAGGISAASNEAHATPVAPSSHGGGSLGWGAIGMLALLRALSSARRSRRES